MCAFKVEVSTPFLESFGSVGGTLVVRACRLTPKRRKRTRKNECRSSIFLDSLVFDLNT